MRQNIGNRSLETSRDSMSVPERQLTSQRPGMRTGTVTDGLDDSSVDRSEVCSIDVILPSSMMTVRSFMGDEEAGPVMSREAWMMVFLFSGFEDASITGDKVVVARSFLASTSTEDEVGEVATCPFSFRINCLVISQLTAVSDRPNPRTRKN